jgi:hypothetical protein
MSQVVARFGTMEDARRAIGELELAGIDAGQVVLRDEPAVLDPSEQRTVDLEETGAWGRRALIGAAVGAVLGAILLIAAVVVTVGDAGATVLLASGLGGAAFGGAVGGYWGVAGSLPVNEAASATRAVDRLDGRLVELEVRAHSPEEGRRIASLLGQRAIEVDT